MNMPTRRSTSTTPAAAKPSVVVPLQKVLYNSEDPTLELDGLIELVIKDERQLQPGVSWTAGSFATEQILTVLCGNHIIVGSAPSIPAWYLFYTLLGQAYIPDFFFMINQRSLSI